MQSRILLYGPPGGGKTRVCHQLLSRRDLCFPTVGVDILGGMYDAGGNPMYRSILSPYIESATWLFFVFNPRDPQVTLEDLRESLSFVKGKKENLKVVFIETHGDCLEERNISEEAVETLKKEVFPKQNIFTFTFYPEENGGMFNQKVQDLLGIDEVVEAHPSFSSEREEVCSSTFFIFPGGAGCLLGALGGIVFLASSQAFPPFGVFCLLGGAVFLLIALVCFFGFLCMNEEESFSLPGNTP